MASRIRHGLAQVALRLWYAQTVVVIARTEGPRLAGLVFVISKLMVEATSPHSRAMG